MASYLMFIAAGGFTVLCLPQFLDREFGPLPDNQRVAEEWRIESMPVRIFLCGLLWALHAWLYFSGR